MVARTNSEDHDDVADESVAGYVVLSTEAALQYFDSEARRELGISGEEFLRRWDAGEFRPIPDTPDGWKIGRLYMLMPLVREITVT